MVLAHWLAALRTRIGSPSNALRPRRRSLDRRLSIEFPESRNLMAGSAFASGPYEVTQGSGVQLDGSGNTDSGHSLMYTWDLNGDGIYGDASGANPYVTWSQLSGLGMQAGNTYKIELEAYDDIGESYFAIGALSITASQSQTYPSVYLSGGTSASLGQTYTLNGTVNDADGDPVTLQIDWGDGSADSTVQLAGSSATQSFSDTHVYNSPTAGSVQVEVTATDSHSHTGAGNLWVSISSASTTNSPPTVSISGPPSVQAGQTYTLSGVVNDPDGGNEYVYINWGDGQSTGFNEAAGQSFTQTHVYNGTPGTNVTESITATDSQAASGTAGQNVTVTSSSTTSSTTSTSTSISLSLMGNGWVAENTAYGLTGAVAGPNGSAVTLVIDWGDGSTATTVTENGAFTVNHTYVDDNPTGTSSDPYSISVSATGGGASTSQTQVVTVYNVPPSVTALNVSVGDKGATTLSANLQDQSPSDTLTLVIDWGDGQKSTYSPGQGAFSTNHSYTPNPATTSYSIQVQLADDDLGSTTAVTSAIVPYIPPPAVLSDYKLQNDTGVSSTDKITTDDSTMGDVVMPSPSVALSVQISLNGNGQVDSTASVDPSGHFTFAPPSLSYGTHTFAARTVELSVPTSQPVYGDWVPLTFDYRSKPVAADTSATTLVDEPVTINVLGMASNADGLPLQPQVVSDPAHGSVTVGSDGSLQYTPEDGYQGSDYFTYLDSDGAINSDTNGVSINVVPATVKLETDSNNDGSIDSVDDAVKMSDPGRAFGIGDFAEFDLQVTIPSGVDTSGLQVVLTPTDGADDVQAFMADQVTPIAFGSPINSSPLVAGETFTQTVYLKGTQAGPVELELALLDQNGKKVATDAAKATVTQVTSVAYDADGSTGALTEDNPASLGGGWRFFPDAQILKGPQAENSLVINAQINTAQAGLPVYFVVVDVDDPSSDPTIDPSDQADDNRDSDYYLSSNGTYVTGNGGVARVNTDASGKATITLDTGMSPGDNYRVIATTSQSEATRIANMTTLQLTANVPTSGDVALASGKATDPVYIWRHLFIETDTMAQGNGSDTQSGTIISTTQDPDTGYYNITTNIKINDEGSYSDGWLRVNGILYSIYNNEALPNDRSMIIVKPSTYGPPPGTGAVTIWMDDYAPPADDQNGVPTLVVNTSDTNALFNLMQASPDRTVNRFADAYIQPDTQTLAQYSSTIPFAPHVKPDRAPDNYPSISAEVGDERVSGAIEDSNFWAVYLATGLEGVPGSSVDRGMGQTSADFQSSMVFLKAIYGEYPDDVDAIAAKVAVHEIGHQVLHLVGHDGRDGTVMDPDPAAVPLDSFFFNDTDIQTMRSIGTSP